MNGAHDMGGVIGHGGLDAGRDERAVHHSWEGRVNAMMRLLLARGLFNLDQFRQAVERIPASEYLASAYYERWLTALEALTRESRDETITLVEHRREARFAPGDPVIVRNVYTKRHTRLARYVAGRRGIVESVHGPFLLPDTRAHLISADWEPVYTVVFEGSELWGDEAGPRDYVSIDLWQSYLEEGHEQGRRSSPRAADRS